MNAPRPSKAPQSTDSQPRCTALARRLRGESGHTEEPVHGSRSESMRWTPLAMRLQALPPVVVQSDETASEESSAQPALSSGVYPVHVEEALAEQRKRSAG